MDTFTYVEENGKWYMVIADRIKIRWAKRWIPAWAIGGGEVEENTLVFSDSSSVEDTTLTLGSVYQIEDHTLVL